MLSPRLKSILDMTLRVQPTSVCDVGCDHAQIPIQLVKNGVKKTIATDVREGPLSAARENVSNSGFNDMIELRLGDGLQPLCDNESDTVIIAGMGGMAICDILSCRRPAGIKHFILQPMKAADKLRRFLSTHGFRIIDEEIVVEGIHIYNIILAEYGIDTDMSDFEVLIGKRLVEKRHPLLPVLLQKEIRTYKKRILGAPEEGKFLQMLIDLEAEICRK